ncbi:hypothetical protein [Streptomyces broussonetiae]|uniref:Uncharacterized protein n=1 Tax=Streptomyces broussonetiae TaxID=2686304 RepID=A0ABV5EAF4_9ACTN
MRMPQGYGTGGEAARRRPAAPGARRPLVRRPPGGRQCRARGQPADLAGSRPHPGSRRTQQSTGPRPGTALPRSVRVGYGLGSLGTGAFGTVAVLLAVGMRGAWRATRRAPVLARSAPDPSLRAQFAAARARGQHAHGVRVLGEPVGSLVAFTVTGPDATPDLARVLPPPPTSRPC